MDVRTEATDLAGALLGSLVNGHSPGVDPKTPARYVRGLAEILSGYQEDPRKHLYLEDSDLDELVAASGISFSSMCAHHVLPFWGKASVAYVPNGRILGLSKFNRIINVFARRLQTQERLTKEIAEFLFDALEPKGVAVIMRGVHTCAAVRGVRDPSMELRTSCILGLFRENAAARAEVFAILGGTL